MQKGHGEKFRPVYSGDLKNWLSNCFLAGDLLTWVSINFL